MSGASRNNEGKLHLGFVYAADPTGRSWHVMAEAAVAFETCVRDLFSLRPQDICLSTPFAYTVCRDSALPPTAIEAHLDQVDTYLRSIDAGYRACQALPDRDLSGTFDTDHVATAFMTPERAVHVGRLADGITRAISKTPAITLRTGTRILGADRLADEVYQLRLAQADGQRSETFDLVINALWDDRLRLDACIGLDAPGPAIMRYKASILFDAVPPDLLNRLPSTTLVSGAFGDLVNRGDGSVYLSWYPVCKLGQTTDIDARALREQASLVDPESLVNGSIDGIARYVPVARELHQLAPTARIGGGVIVAWGQTDITDRSSKLHARENIGVEQTGRWISVNSGKFTTAPAFGLAAAASARDALSG